MKMKKLTALALAGVLCLGMSTTAFAAGSFSPTEETAQENKAVVEETEGVTVDGKAVITGESGDISKDWQNENLTSEKRSERIVKSFENELKAVTEQLEAEDADENLTIKKRAQLEAKQAILEELADPDVLYEVVTIVDLDVINDEDAPTEDDPITIRFNLNGKFDDIEVGQTIRILHLSDDGAVWEVYETEVLLDKNGYYAEWDFTHFSPVAVMRVTETGIVPAEPEDPTEPTDPTDPTDPTIPVDPTQPSVDNNGNGTITADQLADLIVKKLQQNADAAAKVLVRTSGKASPKTGE